MSDLAYSLDHYTYKDYKGWPEDFRCELIYGVVYMMSSPNGWHQQTSWMMARQLDEFFRGTSCTPFTAPYDVRLFPQDNEQDDIVVQPDLMVICDKRKWSLDGICEGAPDLIIEILSQTTNLHDLNTKYELYKRAGVREYWIVSKEAVKVCQFQSDGKAIEKRYDFDAQKSIPSSIFPGLFLKFD